MTPMAQTQTLTQADPLVFDLWQAVQYKLHAEYGEATYRSWLSKLVFVSLQNGHVILSAPTRFIKEWITTHYGERIKYVWQQQDPSVATLDVVIQPSGVVAQPPLTSITFPPVVAAPANSPVATPAIRRSVDAVPALEELSAVLDPRFTFDHFIVGPSNALAHAAARSVAESSKAQPECNPLFLYGGVGLGKTHLMHAIAWHIRTHDPRRRVIYLSAEKFMYQFIRALRNKDIMSFKEQFRTVDVLMIDDVQFICGKDSTQEEFFHTFNAIIDNNRQLVISCDRSPSDLDGMEERIKSRLGWGLVADIHTTTYELRLGILQSKIEQMDIRVPKKVTEFLASKITSNVRELEGALNKVVAHATLVGREITVDTTQEILQDLLRSNERILTVEDIQKKVAERYNLRVSDLISTRRLRSVARPRQVAMYLAKMLTSRSLAEIGRQFGGKDHTTVMHAIKKVEELSQTDHTFQEEVRLLVKILQS